MTEQTTERGRVTERRSMIEIRNHRHEEFLKRRAAERSIETGERLSTARALEDVLERAIAAETDGDGSGRAA